MEPVWQVALSNDELATILRILDAPTMIGLLQSDPPSAHADHTAGEWSLRARRYAALDDDGALKLRRELIELVFACVAPEHTFLMVHQDSSGYAEQAFGHICAHVAVLHQQPNSALHLLTRCASIEVLSRLLIDGAHCSSLKPGVGLALHLPRTVIPTVQALAREQRSDEAIALLHANGCPQEQAERLVGLFCGHHTLSVFYSLQPQRTHEVVGYEWTVIANADQAWCLSTDEVGLCWLEPVSTPQLFERLQRMLPAKALAA